MCIYIINHIIILILSNTEIKKSIITVKVFQSLLFLLILYFFYIIKLLNVCNNSNKKLSVSVFMNDIFLLTYKFSTEINYHILIWMHDCCLNWACRYSIFFAFKKYELIHLIHWLKKFNMWAQLQLKNIVKKIKHLDAHSWNLIWL